MKLNLGCGDSPIEGYINLDGKFGDVIYPLAYQEVDEIRASHVLEHFGREESFDVLQQWASCLKIGGILKIAVPDFSDLMRRKGLGEILPFEDIIMGGQVDDTDYHKSLWDLDKLRTLMGYCGLTEIQSWYSPIRDCASYPFSLNLQGVKRG
jgi:hypothetical protein